MPPPPPGAPPIHAVRAETATAVVPSEGSGGSGARSTATVSARHGDGGESHVARWGDGAEGRLPPDRGTPMPIALDRGRPMPIASDRGRPMPEGHACMDMCTEMCVGHLAARNMW